MRRSHFTFVLPSHPGQQQAHRIPVFRTEAFAVLVDRNQRVVERLVDGMLRLIAAASAALGEQPAAGGTHARLLKKRAERHARPFAARQEAVQRAPPTTAPAARRTGLCCCPSTR
jgi:hypothetical protein